MARHILANDIRVGKTLENLTEPALIKNTELNEVAHRYYPDSYMDDAKCALLDTFKPETRKTIINGVLIPETRAALGNSEDANVYDGDGHLREGRYRPIGTIPPQNMHREVQKVGHRVCTIDETNPKAMWKSILQQMSMTPKTFTFDFLNRYPAGAPLTKSEIEALKKNKLCPCLSFHKDKDGKVDSVDFSDGALCTGYVQLLDDALQLFKQYFPTLIGKVCTTDYPYTVIPQRIVYDPSRLVKSCFNPVINEAAQIALECEVIKPDGSKLGTGFLYLSNPSVYNRAAVPTTWTTDNWVFAAVGQQLIWECAAGHKDLPALALIISCSFFSEDFE